MYFHATVSKLVECIVHGPFALQEVDDGTPNLAIGMQELRSCDCAKREGRVWLKQAHVGNLLVQCFGVKQMHCLAKGEGVAKHLLNALQPAGCECSALHADLGGVIKESVRQQLCFSARGFMGTCLHCFLVLARREP